MIIFVIPGFSSHNPNRKFEVLKNDLPKCRIVGLTYTSNDPKVIYDEFVSQIAMAVDYYDHKDFMFIGTSLGAFWALNLSNKYGTKSVIINPSLSP